MAKKFAERNQLNLSDVNHEVLKDWDANDVFHKSMTEREGCPSFIFFEGPPSANGHPGIHHVMARSIKDVFCRYKTMKGFQVKRKAGWDTHGLPVELGVEKELGITKEDIGKTISIEEYNRKCRTNVMQFTEEWTDLSHRMGYWVDLEHPYITYDNKYIETLWFLLKELYKKGLLYKGYTIQPYSPAAGTGLSSHELNQPGCYRDVKDTTVTGLFKIAEPKAEWKEWGTAYFAAWTTTPWTLPSNTALCVGPKIEYVAVQTYNGYTGEPITVIVAKSRLNAYLKAEGAEIALADYKAGDKVIPYKIVGEYTGNDLVGIKYEQLMPWVKPTEKLDDNAADFVKKAAEADPSKVFAVGNDKFVELSSEAFRVIPGDYVTTEDGTGIVHIAPTFGADDAKVAKAAGIPSLFIINKAGETRPMVDLTGKYYTLDEVDETFAKVCVDAEAYGKHAGDYVKNAYDPKFNEGGKYDEQAAAKAEDLNVVICMEMKQAGTAYKIEKHVHNYPHCWRTDKPVLYYPLDSWFIRSTAMKDRMVELNKTILWKPESTGTGRFGKWLENLNDWNLSRSRYWGTPLPIWRTEDGKEEICIGSIAELFAEIDKSVKAGFMKANPWPKHKVGDYSKENYDPSVIDLHRPYVDNIILVSPKGQPMKRELDLIDVWFDSGAMPYAQNHYPFENADLPRTADFISEGVDQTRGWFFTLHAIHTMIEGSVAYKNVISNGLVLDKNGNKMSKRLGNAVDPFGALDTYGADAVRWYMLTNSSPWENLKFDPEGVDEVRRKFFGTLYNTYGFFALYANVDGWDSTPNQTNETQSTENRNETVSGAYAEIDLWVLSKLNSLVKEVTEAYEAYEPTKAGRAISDFVQDDLSNWYVRLNRKRFWGGEMNADKQAAYQTLYTCLKTVAQLMAPNAPFYADRLYRDLTGQTVHLSEWPKVNEALINNALERQMFLAQQATSMILSLRKRAEKNVRQPLQKAVIPTPDKETTDALLHVADLIKSEVNVKELIIVPAEQSEIRLVKKIKPQFKVLGKKVGADMKAVAAEINAMSQDDIARMETEGSYTLHNTPYTLIPEDVDIITEDMPGWLVANNGILTIALDIELNDALIEEGVARELVNRIQNLRKSSGLEITDRIIVTLQDRPEIHNAVLHCGEYIASQVLASTLDLASDVQGDVLEMDGYTVTINLQKA